MTALHIIAATPAGPCRIETDATLAMSGGRPVAFVEPAEGRDPEAVAAAARARIRGAEVGGGWFGVSPLTARTAVQQARGGMAVLPPSTPARAREGAEQEQEGVSAAHGRLLAGEIGKAGPGSPEGQGRAAEDFSAKHAHAREAEPRNAAEVLARYAPAHGADAGSSDQQVRARKARVPGVLRDHRARAREGQAGGMVADGGALARGPEAAWSAVERPRTHEGADKPVTLRQNPEPGTPEAAASYRPHLPRSPMDVKAVRKGTGLSQGRFATAFGIPLPTLQDWEQGRSHPDMATRAYLRVIQRQPDMVREALKAG